MIEICGCCEGVQAVTPLAINNRPGLERLVYRVGTHGAFLETMKARLSSFYLDIPLEETGPDGKLLTRRIYPMRNLTTRAADDFSIAVLDAWAEVADVLTFYQERIANEGYLRTAAERRSVLELARLVGYALRPGVSASVFLAYTLDPTLTDPVQIPVGTRAQSLPGPGELPQTFETADPFEARSSWNLLSPRMTRPQTAEAILDENNPQPQPRVYLKGIATNLKKNDPLLIDFGDGTPLVLFRILAVSPDATADRTLVTIEHWFGTALTARQRMALLSPQEVVANIRQNILEISARFRGPEAAARGVTTQSQVFGRVADLLNGLEEKIQAGAAFPELVAHLQDQTLQGLQAELEAMQARPSQFAALRPWLQDLVNSLNVVAEQAPAQRAETAAAEFALADTSPERIMLPRASEGGDGTPPEPGPASHPPDADTLKLPLAGLTKPPSLHPRNTFALQRSLATEFQAKGESNLQMMDAIRPDDSNDLRSVVANSKVTVDIPIKVYALRVKASLFGYNAPVQPVYVKDTDNPKEYTLSAPPTISNTWLGADGTRLASKQLALDAQYDQIIPGSYAVTVFPKAITWMNPFPFSVDAVNSLTLGGAMVSSKVSVLDVEETALSDILAKNSSSNLFLGGTSVFAQSEELALAEEPIDDSICGSQSSDDANGLIELDDLYNELKAGRWLIVSGERTDIQTYAPDGSGDVLSVPGIQSSELVMLSSVEQRLTRSDPAQSGSYHSYYGQPQAGEKTHTFIRLAGTLAYCYKRDTVKIYGNVVRANNGETRSESLGSGDASKAFQAFTLKQTPLTYVSASNPSGVESTLHVRVNDIEWHETDGLSELGPTDRNFITQTDDDGKTTVQFGNGRQGARPPTGIENIKSVYRFGIGSAGNVQANQISMLATRPLGVKEVINPLRASGGADKETRDQARKNVPVAILALDRLVSTQDYADFSRTFAGIGKARAERLSDGRQRVVHVTIAGANDIPIDETSDLYLNLVSALRSSGDPHLPIKVQVRELMLMVLSANIRILPDYLWEKVASSVRAALLAKFSFENQDLGQAVFLSSVISAIQAVEGVDYVDVDMLGGVSERGDDGSLRTPEDIGQTIQKLIQDQASGPAQTIQVRLAGAAKGVFRPAQLAFFTPIVESTIILNEVTA